MDFLTFQEAADLAGVSVKTIHRHVARGKLQAIDTPMGRRLSRTEMDPYVQLRRDSPGPFETEEASPNDTVGQVEAEFEFVQESPGQSETGSDNVRDSPGGSTMVPLAALQAALEFAERRIAEERQRTEDAQRQALIAERAKVSLEVQMSQYQRILSEHADSLAEERAHRLMAESQLLEMAEQPPLESLKVETTTPKRSWGKRIGAWFGIGKASNG